MLLLWTPRKFLRSTGPCCLPFWSLLQKTFLAVGFKIFNENVTEITRSSLEILDKNAEAPLDTLARIPQW